MYHHSWVQYSDDLGVLDGDSDSVCPQNRLIAVSKRSTVQLEYFDHFMQSCILFVTGPVRINQLSAKKHQFLECLLYHNLITIYTTATESLSLLQNLMCFLLQLTEMR